MGQDTEPRRISRRRLLAGAARGALAGATLTLLEACGPAPATTASEAPATPRSRARIGPGGVADDAILLGMSGAFRGASQALGIELYRGAAAYLRQVNQAGGVHGRQILVQAYDDGYDPLRALQNTLRLAEDDEAFALWNYVGTPTVTRVLPLLKRYENRHLLMLFPFTGAQPQREPPYSQYVFNLRASYRQETAGLVANLAAVGRRRFGLFYQADAYGRSGWDGVRRALAGRGLGLVAEATYRRGAGFATSMLPQVELLRQADADLVVAVGAYAACAAFIRDARAAGWDVPVANLSFVGAENMLALLREGGAGLTTNLINSQVVPSYADTSLPAVAEYRAAMAGGPALPPPELLEGDYSPPAHSYASFEGFLNARLLVAILQALGPRPRRELLAQAIAGLGTFDLGLPMPLRFGPDRRQASDAVYYTSVQDGQIVALGGWEQWAP